MKSALILLALASPLLRGEDSYSLVAHPAQGDVFHEQERFWSGGSGDATDDAANRPSFAWEEAMATSDGEDGSVLSRERTYEDEILDVRDGARMKVRRTFEVSSSTSVDPDHADAHPERVSALFEGETIVLVADGSGTRLIGELDDEEDLAPSDLDLSPRWELALPRTPVEIGDSWALPAKVASRLLEPLTPRSASARCELVAVEAGESGPVARLHLEAHGTSPGSLEGTSEIESSGQLLWDIDGGHLIEVTVSGEVHTWDLEGRETTRRFGLAHETRKLE